MPSVTVSTTIAQPRDRVFDFLDDLTRHETFTDHSLVDWDVTLWPATGVGASARMRATGAGRHPWITITVVESVRPRRTVEEGRGGKDGRRRTRGIYELADAGPDVTTVSFTNQFARPAPYVPPTRRRGRPLRASRRRRRRRRRLQERSAVSTSSSSSDSPARRVAPVRIARRRRGA
jgi:hypothetical protein